MDQIGVIIPVYKVEAYLDRCVKSVLEQTYRDFVLILVDDGSPDNCGALCDEYAKMDNRIHVIHQQNGGLSAARNAGLDHLASQKNCQWVTFVDSDDWIHPGLLETLMTAVEEQCTKIGVCGFEETSGDTPIVLPEQMQSECWKPEAFYTSRFINATVAWGKLYHKSLFETIRFPKGKLHEDEFTTYKLLFSQDKIAVVVAPLYGYFVNPVGITKSQWKAKRLDAWEAFEEQLAYFQAHDYPELVAFRLRGYLENALVNLEGARSVADGRSVRLIKKRIRRLIRRCWHGGVIHFQYDFDLLIHYYPITTRIYRLYLEMKEK